MDKKTMMDCVYKQLAIDYNCLANDFLRDGLIFTEARDNEGRRQFPWRTPRLEMISMGRSVVINASADILPYVREKLNGKTRDEVFGSPFIYGINPYFLPDVDKIIPLTKSNGFEYEIVEQQDIHKLYEFEGFNYALQYNVNSMNPEMLTVLAIHKGKIVGIASGSADCKTMWQIGVDVLLPYRSKGIATSLVNMLTLEILNRGYIPYYFTSDSNVSSIQVAIRSGYIPAWVHCYNTRLEYLLI